MDLRRRILQKGHKVENSPKMCLLTFLLRKRKENKRDLLHSVNTNENHYQFDVVLILLWADFVIIVVEIERG